MRAPASTCRLSEAYRHAVASDADSESDKQGASDGQREEVRGPPQRTVANDDGFAGSGASAGAAASGSAAANGETAPGDGNGASGGAVAEDPDLDFFVVGVGASAGGLEALAALVRNIPPDTMSFVVIQHLSPNRESMLAELLARQSNIRVETAADGMRVERNRIYVIPPNANLSVSRGVLHLHKLESGRGPRLPVDHFFRSLAEDQGVRAIGVVLSGTGTDGTLGLQAIKAAGGVTFVQDPSSARYDGMPSSALESGSADFCLEPKAIAEELLRVSEHPYLARERQQGTDGLREQLGRVFALLRTASRHDLSQYKTSTIERRIERRMALVHVEKLEDYLTLLASNREELALLYKDLLIGVTSFFRDGEPFETLKARALPRIVEGLGPGAPVRVWVPGCSTGEEAYSLAIILLELLGERARDHRVQIFGTDVDPSAIERARRGVFPPNIALDVSPERLSRFFAKHDGNYQVSRRVRDVVVFSTHNVIRDAPFSRLDLVSCRNLLIYLQAPLQKRVLRVLHYALNPSGFLLLGTSETVGDSADLFSLVDRKSKLFLKKHVAFAAAPPEPGFPGALSSSSSATPFQPPTVRPAVNLTALADRKILELFGPPGVVINENLEILQFRGRTGPYLEPAPGAATLQILRLARPELNLELHRTIHRAIGEDKRVSGQVRVGAVDKPAIVTIDVLPIVEPESKTRCFLVLFQESQVREHRALAAPPPEDEGRVQELTRELLMTKEYLQSTIEELESTNEEHKSANEELQSANEELQSTNEELETSKEELQSSNEELTTVNDELQTRMQELSTSNDDLHNLLTGVDSAVVIAGNDLRIRRFTVAAEKVLNLVASDLGRRIGFLNPFFRNRNLDEIAAEVMAKVTPHEEELQSADGRWFSLRIAPYLTLERAVMGAVVVLADVDTRRRAAELLESVNGYADRFLRPIQNPLLILDGTCRVVWANEPWLATFQVVREEVVGLPLEALAGRRWADPTLRARIVKTLATGESFRNLRVQGAFVGPREGDLGVSGSRIPALGEHEQLLLLSVEVPRPPGPEAA
jgi:two-component system, chemotaxis family, CheB/CheR fusion protein